MFKRRKKFLRTKKFRLNAGLNRIKFLGKDYLLHVKTELINKCRHENKYIFSLFPPEKKIYSSEVLCYFKF